MSNDFLKALDALYHQHHVRVLNSPISWKIALFVWWMKNGEWPWPESTLRIKTCEFEFSQVLILGNRISVYKASFFSLAKHFWETWDRIANWKKKTKPTIEWQSVHSIWVYLKMAHYHLPAWTKYSPFTLGMFHSSWLALSCFSRGCFSNGGTKGRYWEGLGSTMSTRSDPWSTFSTLPLCVSSYLLGLLKNYNRTTI